MWRQKSVAENADSDQSISEEEDCVSLSGAVHKKEEFHILSQLEALQGDSEQIHGRKSLNLSYKKEGNLSLEDEVKTRVKEDDFSVYLEKPNAWHSDEEIVSDDGEHFMHSDFPLMAKTSHEDIIPDHGNKRPDGSYIWSRINKEADELGHLNKSISCSPSYSALSKENFSKGIKGKAKQKFSFPLQSRRKELSYSFTPNGENNMLFRLQKSPEAFTATECKMHMPGIADRIEDFAEENEKQLNMMHVEAKDLGRESTENSIAELLDGLQDKNSMPRESSKLSGRASRKQEQVIEKRNMLSLADGNIDGEDLFLDSESSSDYDDNDQNLKLSIAWIRKQTITDKFDEALGTTTLNTKRGIVVVAKPLGVGLFGKLQEVMQSEKHRDIDFLDTINSGTTSNDEPGCIEVKILARNLEAKLTVCRCSFMENVKMLSSPSNPKNMVDGERKRTVIFNSRVCTNLDLDVGNMIRIHPPWKEVPVGYGENIILCTYFSQIST